MDTRSVIRSRRQSARLHQQPRDSKAAEQSMHNRRVSGTNVSRKRAKSVTSEPAIPKEATIKRAHSATESTPNVTPEPPVTAKSRTKDGGRVANSSMFPNLPPTKNTSVDDDDIQRNPDMELLRKPFAEASDNIGTERRVSRVSARWVKTAQGAMRLVEDTPHNASAGPTTQSEKAPHGDDASLPENRRRSARLSSTTEKAPPAPTTPLEKGREVELQHAPHTASQANSSDSSLTDLDELPPYSGLPFADGPDEELDFAEKTSPIPALVADIAKIIETSSPIAARTSQIVTSNVATSTEASAVKTTSITVLAPDSTGVADSTTEAAQQVDYTLSCAQPATYSPLPLDCTPGVSSGGINVPHTFEENAATARATSPDTITEGHCQSHSPRGVKRPVEEMSHDEQTPVRHQPPGSSSRPFSLVTPTRTANLIESASSRDCYDAQYDELGSPGAGLWPDGENYSPQPQHQSDSPRGAEQITVQGEEHNPAASEHGAGHLPHLQTITKCGDCGKTPRRFIVCAKCLKTRYCGRYCQIWNWPIHRRSCQDCEEANPGEVERQEEYLKGMWAGALRVLKENVIDRGPETDGEMKEQAALQAMVDSSFVGHESGENTVEQRIGLHGDGGEAVTGEDGSGQEEISMSLDEVMGDSVMTDQHVQDDVQDREDAVFKMPPPSPESMSRSRAMALRLAQAAEF